MTEKLHKDHHDSNGHQRRASVRQLFEKALDCNGGNRVWRLWKESQTEEIVKIGERAERLTIHRIDLSGDLDIVYEIKQPVPRIPRADGELVVDELAIYRLHYAEEWTVLPPAPWWPLSLIRPFDPWHPNMRRSLEGAICLGTVGKEENRTASEDRIDGTLAGVSPKEILMIGFFAVQLDNVVLDERDPNGVLNQAACDYYRNFPKYLPLTKAGLFESWEGWKGVEKQ